MATQSLQQGPAKLCSNDTGEGIGRFAALAGITGAVRPSALADGFGPAMVACAVVAAAGGAIAAATVRQGAAVHPTAQADVVHPCHDPCRSAEAAA